MANNLDQVKLASPRIFLFRMLVFLVLCGLIGFVLQKQILNAFNANPWLNGLIGLVLLIGIVLSFARVIRLFPEVSWVNGYRRADLGRTARPPTLLAPMAAILGSDRAGRRTISAQTMRAFLDLLANRLDEARQISRHPHWPARIPRPARHLLGPDRDGELGRHHHQQSQCRRRCRYGLQLAEGRPGRAARRHGHLVLVILVRARRLADPRLSRSANEPGAKPLLHQSRGLARDHGGGNQRGRPLRRRRAAGQHDRSDRAAALLRQRSRLRQGDDRGHGQPACRPLATSAR